MGKAAVAAHMLPHAVDKMHDAAGAVGGEPQIKGEGVDAVAAGQALLGKITGHWKASYWERLIGAYKQYAPEMTILHCFALCQGLLANPGNREYNKEISDRRGDKNWP